MTSLLHILHEDERLLVINKPAGLVCHPTKGDATSSLVGRVRLHLGETAPAHLINRLDRETSGLVVVAKADAAARELRRSWETRTVEKRYLAIVHGHPAEDSAVVQAPLGKDDNSRVAIKDRVRADGLHAVTRFRVMRRFRREGRLFALLQVVPETGRKHQIRIHLAHAGHPIVGDKIYGEDETAYLRFVERALTLEDQQRLLLPHHALHAHALRFPWAGGHADYAAPPEAWFAEFAGITGEDLVNTWLPSGLELS